MTPSAPAVANPAPSLRRVAAPLWLGLLAVFAACASTPAPAVNTAPQQAGAATGAAAGAAGTTEQKKAAPRAILLFSGGVGESLPAPLRQAFGADVHVPSGGALAAAAQTVAMAQKAIPEMRCSEALPALSQAAERVLSETLLPDARPLLGELYGLMLLCADRVNDAQSAQLASEALRAMQITAPPDVALVLARYATPARFGPPRAPTHIETDPPGAAVLRNFVPVGPAPVDVPGGQAEHDFIDVELPGYRKIHRGLGSGQQLVLELRPEDRSPVLLDRAALYPAGSDGQEAVLRALADTAGAKVLPSRLVLAISPKQRGGAPLPGEALVARVYDLDRKAWVGAASEVAAGAATAQAQTLVALCTTNRGETAPNAASAVAATKQAPAEKKGGFKLPFSNTKWYTWVVAGGVAALIAGLLIAEKVSPEKVTISASH